MRPVLLLLAASLSVPLACSTQSPTPATVAGDDDDAMAVVEEAGSPAACTAAGGTCVTFQTECPTLQQNTVLCGDSVMICCLPPDDAAPYLGPPDEAGPDTGSPMGTDAAPEAAPESGPVEASLDGSNG